jgi:proton-coupled amino acid transporter
VSDRPSASDLSKCITNRLPSSLIPITEAMKEPHKFPKVLTFVMVGVALLFAGFGIMGYSAYGSDIQTVVIVNLPQDKKFVQVVQFLYTIAIVLR